MTEREDEGASGLRRFLGDAVPPRLPSDSGPRIARLFHSLLALNLLVAWVSLGSQIQLLVGSRGLLPLAPLLETVQGREAEVWLRFLEAYGF